jgi:hypothetical protein
MSLLLRDNGLVTACLTASVCQVCTRIEVLAMAALLASYMLHETLSANIALHIPCTALLLQQLEPDEQPIEAQQLHTSAIHRTKLQYEVPVDSTEAWLIASKLQWLEKDKALTTALKDCSAGEGRVQVKQLSLVTTYNYYALSLSCKVQYRCI